MIRALATFCLTLITAAAVHAEPATTSAAKRPTTAIDEASCVTAECHAGIKASAVVHGPVATNACGSCHELTSAEQHTYNISRQKADLCTYCHEFSVAGMPTIHKPVAEGECLGCHDPHGGANKAIVREATTRQLCGRCHENVTAGKAFAHSPVAQGACDSCHPPHASKFPKLLDVVGSDMCLACHKEFEPSITDAKFKHKALEKGCTQCHSAHGSGAPMSLSKAVPDLCMDCHEKLKDQIANATVPHSAISLDRTCMNCHAAHASNVGKLLTEVPATGCLNCHKKEIKTGRGYVVAAVREVADPKLVKHGEIKDGQCGGCHDVHGGQRAMLLAKPYSRTFYQDFSTENYALCFGCHDAQLAEAQKTTKATSFRNGDVNLHYVHARSGTRDKNCRTCHLSHAGPNERIIRTSLRYGKWEMPMHFQKTETGGSCFPGCHAQWAYDREKPVPTTAPTTLPTSFPALVATRAEREDGQMITWSATDVSGKAVSVPADHLATALVLVAADDASADQVVDRLHNAVGQVKGTQVVVIFSGAGSEQHATGLAKSGKAGNWPIVADANHEAAQALGVRGWPMVLVLRPDGLEVARVTGDATFLAIKLPPYLERASGRIDEKTLEQRLASQPVVESDVAKRTARDLRTARVLLDEKKPAQALAFLDRDAKASAKLPEAMALRAEALIQLKKPDDALLMLNQIPEGTLPAGRFEVLRARAFMAQERWDMAKYLLETALTKTPDLAEAHRLLGELYEQEQNWAKAAEHYRAASEKGPKAP